MTATTLRTFLILFPNHSITFDDDDYIQVLDNKTDERYHFNENNSLFVGKHPAPVTFTELLDKKIDYVKFNPTENKLEVYVR